MSTPHPGSSGTPSVLPGTCKSRGFLAWLSLCFLFVPVTAAADWLLTISDPAVVPGQMFEVIVIGPEPGSEVFWPGKLTAQIEPIGNVPPIGVELVALDSQDEKPDRRHYLGRWPDEVAGIAALTLTGYSGHRLLLNANPVAVARVASRATSDDEADQVVAEETPPVNVVSPSALTSHEPMYFVAGGESPFSARLQFSFKYRIFDDHGVVAESVPFTRGLYFGFTQTSLWDLQSESKPFHDTSFRPTLFYNWGLFKRDDGDSLSLSLGYEHESNGKDNERSRSIDLLFIRTELRHHLNDGPVYVGVAPKVWTYLDRDDNPDIARYRGYGELGLRIGRDDGLMLSSLVRHGTAGKMSTQLDLSYPIRTSVFSGVGAFVHLQAFRGYGETLLDYNIKRQTQYRLGISLVR